MVGSKVYHQDTQQAVADLLAQGDLVALPVGSDKNRQLIITEWGKKLVKKHGGESLLKRKFFVGNIQTKIEELLNTVYLTLKKPVIRPAKPVNLVQPKSIFIHHLTQRKNNKEGQNSCLLQAKILAKQKTPLTNL